MYSKYSIGKMAKLLGISSEAIRYYENKGIILPLRDENSGYRYYNTWDLHMLLHARYYQSYGFSLDEVSDLFHTMELEEISSQMSNKEKDIEDEIARQINMLKRIRHAKQMLVDASNSIGKYNIATRPGIYRINTQKNYVINNGKNDQRLIEEWSKKEPFVFSTAVFHENDIRNHRDIFDFGLGIDEEYAKFLNVEANEFVEYYPPCTCIHTCIPSRSSQYLSLDRFKEAFEYLASQGFKLDGDIVTQVVCMSKPEDEYYNWHIVWIPIKTN